MANSVLEKKNQNLFDIYEIITFSDIFKLWFKKSLNPATILSNQNVLRTTLKTILGWYWAYVVTRWWKHWYRFYVLKKIKIYSVSRL